MDFIRVLDTSNKEYVINKNSICYISKDNDGLCSHYIVLNCGRTIYVGETAYDRVVQTITKGSKEIL